MRKRATIIFAVIAALCITFICGCAEEKPQPREKYVVFTNNYQEKIQLIAGCKWTVEYDYDVTKTYKFEYEVFYDDDDSPTGESGESEWIRGDKPGTYNIYARYNYSNFVQDCMVIVIIKEKPLITPEVRFDPNGATVEERDGETIYVYDYDGKDHFPLIELYHDSEQLKLDLYNDGIVSIELNGEFYRYHRPRAIGKYKIEYWVYDDDYVNVEYRNKFRGAKATITVEIR